MPLHTEPKRTDSTKKTLALFGKRGTFKYTSVATEVKSRNPVLLPPSGNKSDEEELEETEEKEENAENKATEKETPSADLEHNQPTLDVEQIDKPSTSTRLVAPSEPIEMKHEPKTDQAEDQDRTAVPDDSGEENTKPISTTDSNNSSSNSVGTKKKRNRIRIRTDKSRENVDFDEEMVDTEKYSTWLPPQGQSGDGSTDLNVKYGY